MQGALIKFNGNKCQFGFLYVLFLNCKFLWIKACAK